jgi:hypothetical protein
MEPEKPAKSWRDSFLLRRLPLVVALGLAALLFLQAAPRDVALVYDLGNRRDGLKTVFVDLAPAGAAAIRHSQFMRPLDSGWPASLSHTVRLTPGDYHVHVTLEYADRSDSVERDLSVTRETERLVLFLEP